MAQLSWKRLFSSVILARGLEYYRKGAILDLKEEEDGVYTAIARGTKDYLVKADFHARRTLLKCDCPHARSGWRCKHMAALLYAIDGLNGVSDDAAPAPKKAPAKKKDQMLPAASLFSPREDLPQEDTFKAGSVFYDLRAILEGKTLSASDAATARSLLEKNALRPADLRLYRDKTDRLCGLFTIDEDKRSYYFRTQVEMTRDRLLYAHCGCSDPLCRKSGADSPVLCAHLTASFLFLDLLLQREDLFDSTDTTGRAVLSRFGTGEDLPRTAREGKLLSLSPVLQIPEADRWNLCFRIGSGRSIYCGNLSELTDAIRSGGRFPLSGALGEADFSVDRFDDESQRLADFLCRWKENDRALEHQYGSASSPEDALPLYGERLDDFYDLCRGKTLPIRAGKGKALTLKEGFFRPEVSLSLVHTDGRLSGAAAEGTCPETALGLKYAYWISPDETALVRADAAPVRLWQKHLPSLHGAFSFRVGRGSLPDFYRRVVPFLRENADLTESEEDGAFLSGWLPPEVEITFYLDAEEDRSTCRVEAVYGEEKFPLLPGPEDVPAWRDRMWERGALRAATALFPRDDPDRGLLYRPMEDQFTYELMTRGIPEMEKWGKVLATDRFSSVRVRRNFQVRAGVSLSGGLMDLDVTCTGLSPAELAEILRAYAPGKKWHRLKSGDFVDLQDPGMEDLLALMKAAHADPKEFARGKMHLPAFRALYLDALLKERREIQSARDPSFRDLIRTFKTVSESDFDVPASLREVLRPYQAAGFQWMMTLASAGFCGILADDMGLGKTVQMIAVLLYAKEHRKGPGLPDMVVCPASLVYNWEAEVHRFAPQLKTCVVSGTAGDRHALIARSGEYDLLISSYDLVKRDTACYEDLSFDLLVLDEAQYIKTASSAAAKSCKVLRAAHRFALTGTPIENDLSELWSIFDFLMPGFLYDYPAFRREIELPAVRNGQAEAMERLKKMVSPFLLRRLKKDVLKDLPDKLEETRFVALEGLQDQLYSAQVLHLKQTLVQESEEEFAHDRIRILAELTRLRQICCDPSLNAEAYAGPSAKREALRDLLTAAAAGGHKVLVFSQFTSMLALIEKDLKESGLSYYLLTGATPKAERTRMASCFNRDDVPVFLISLKAGGTGLNLTGADMVVHYDPWWNAAATNQATDRAHRIGQEKTVTVYRLVCKNTIEEQIIALQKTKQDLAEELLNGGNTGLGRMSRDELLALLDR